MNESSDQKLPNQRSMKQNKHLIVVNQNFERSEVRLQRGFSPYVCVHSWVTYGFDYSFIMMDCKWTGLQK